MIDHFVIVPFQNGRILRENGRAHGAAGLLPRDAKVLRALVEAGQARWEDLANSAGMIGEWAHSDLFHSIARVKKNFENSLVIISSTYEPGLRQRHHVGWNISGPIEIERQVQPI